MTVLLAHLRCDFDAAGRPARALMLTSPSLAQTLSRRALGIGGTIKLPIGAGDRGEIAIGFARNASGVFSARLALAVRMDGADLSK